MDEECCIKYKDLMDEDYFFSIFIGLRGFGNGRIKVGVGCNINVKKKR